MAGCHRESESPTGTDIGEIIVIVSIRPGGSRVEKVTDVTGLYVTPGLIDMHMHIYGYSTSCVLFSELGGELQGKNKSTN